MITHEPLKPLVASLDAMSKLLAADAATADRLCIPVARVYVDAAVVSLRQAHAAIERFDRSVTTRRDPLREDPPTLDPRLLEWLD